ncbi:MAG: bifunctional glutamate N-acetyltransferase/amino-acid acetyltransferase ArgJ [Thermodesulfobacteriota bacterium]
MSETETVRGFQAGAVKAGIRGKDRLDVGLIYSEKPAAAAGVFTTSLVKAAPVLLDMEHLRSGRARAIIVNSGVANACTGEMGMALARGTAGLVARRLGLAENEVLVASTGVIGMQLDLAIFANCMEALAASLTVSGFTAVSRAMMTTDTVPKTAVRVMDLAGQRATILGLAKGAGMIMPNMATMLAFIVTDAAVRPAVLQDMLARSVRHSFNAITVDGDTSTNDTVLVLANGAAGNQEIGDGNSEDGRQLQQGLDAVCRDLALQIVRDGEGATKLVTIRVVGAQSDDDAERAARTVANSNLVKTAFFGEDANWGRIIAALGRSGAVFDPYRVDISFDDVMLVRDGLARGSAAEERATAVLRQKEFTVLVDLKNGTAGHDIHTCDFSIDYVKINADYRS